MADSFDQHAHREMWHRFCRMVTWASVGTAVTLILMAIFLV